MIPFFKDIPSNYEISSPQEKECCAEQAQPPILKTVVSHSAKDFIGQCLGRTAGLGVFTAITHHGLSPITAGVWIGSVGALAAGTQAFLISKHQIGTASFAQKTAVALCTLTAAAAGASIVALGSAQPVAAVAIGAAATTAVSLLKYCLFTQPENLDATEVSKAVVFGMSTAASLVLMSGITPNWIAAESTLANRSIGILAESSVIELCKFCFEQVSPSANRNALTFNGKVKAALLALVPYAAATVLFNGFVSSSLQPSHDSHEFMELWTPLLVGALSNAVRGGANAASVLYVHQTKNDIADPEAQAIRPLNSVMRADMHVLTQKTALRFTLSCCRNALYFNLREHGLSVMQAACVTQSCYAFYAQSRDLMYDLMQGEGWSEPVLTVRGSSESRVTV